MRRLLPLASLLLLGARTLEAQVAASDPMNVAIAVRGGVTMATARGDFPSLIVGDSRRATGAIGQQHARSEIGGLVDVAALVPFMPELGLSLSLGSQVLAVSYPEDSMRYATRLDLQTLRAGIGVQWSPLQETSSYAYGGLRSVFIDGGLDIGLAMLANRLESTVYDDTLGATRRASDASFESGEPFRTVVALRAGVGLRFAVTPNVEIVAETSYSHALNPVFSSEAITDNDFTLDALRASLALAYRF